MPKVACLKCKTLLKLAGPVSKPTKIRCSKCKCVFQVGKKPAPVATVAADGTSIKVTTKPPTDKSTSAKPSAKRATNKSGASPQAPEPITKAHAPDETEELPAPLSKKPVTTIATKPVPRPTTPARKSSRRSDDDDDESPYPVKLLVTLGVLTVVLLVCFSGSIFGFLFSGPGRVNLAGSVTLDNQPLEIGGILLIPLDPTKGTATGGKIENGKYDLNGAQAPFPGAYKVEIRGLKKTGRQIQQPMGQSGQMMDEMIEAVPPRFNAVSELKVTVDASKPTADFAVSSQ